MTATGYVGGDPSKVDADGYVKGDILAANSSGVLTAVPVGPDLDVLTADSSDNEGVDWQTPTGGSGTPSNTVVTETSFGQASTAGVLTSYSRGDHTHGTPTAPSVPSAAGSVVSETAFGQSPAVGVGTAYARDDHTHGTPAAPSVPSASGSVVSETTYSQSPAAGVATTYSRGDHTHGTPALPTPSAIGANETLIIDQAYDTSGNKNTNTGGGWVPLGFVGIQIAAAVGDYVAFDFGFLNQAGNFLDAAVVVSGTPVIYMSSGTGTQAVEGAPWWYVIGGGIYRTSTPPFGFTVTAPMLSGGNVVVDLYANGSSTGQVFASTSYPFFWRAINYGVVL